MSSGWKHWRRFPPMKLLASLLAITLAPGMAIADVPIASSSFTGVEDPLYENGAWAPLTSLAGGGPIVRVDRNNTGQTGWLLFLDDDVGVSGYLVERCQGAACSNFAQIAIVAGTTFDDTGLPSATTCTYRVRAADAAGNLSPYSNTASATTLAF